LSYVYLKKVLTIVNDWARWFVGLGHGVAEVLQAHDNGEARIVVNDDSSNTATDKETL